jgi:hypothetical protein
MSAVAESPNGVSSSDFYDPPISNIGGLKRAKQDFTTLHPQILIEEFRSNLSSVIGNTISDPDNLENILESNRVREKLKENLLDELRAEDIDVDEDLLSRILENSVEVEVSKPGSAEEFALHEFAVQDVMTATSVRNTERKPPVTARINVSDAIVAGVSLLSGNITTDPTSVLIALYIVKSVARPNVEKVTEHQALSYAVGWESTEEGEFMYKQDLINKITSTSSTSSGLNKMDEDAAEKAIQELERIGCISMEDTAEGIMIWFEDEFNVEYTLDDV